MIICFNRIFIIVTSPSPWRAWIEILGVISRADVYHVALPVEGVD